MDRTMEIDVHQVQWHAMLTRLFAVSGTYIEMMAAAYQKETNLPASEVELVQQMDGYKIRWYFQKRES